MGRWGFWDWVAYVCLGTAAIGLAAGTAMKETPTVWEKIPSFFSAPAWGYAPIILFALGTVILAIRYVLVPGANSSTASVSNLAAPASLERVFINVSTDYLRSLYKDRTDIQGDVLAAAYIGKWLRITGTVSNSFFVDIGPGSWTIMLKDANSLENQRTSVHLRFDPKWRDQVSSLNMNQQISVIGKISSIKESAVTFVDTELVDAQTERN